MESCFRHSEKRKFMSNNELVLKNDDGSLYTTSLIIAEVFNREHNNVLKKIRKLIEDCSKLDLDTGVNFYLSEYKDSSGKINEMYKFGKLSCEVLIMEMVGNDTLKWKIKFANAFNEMENIIKKSKQLSKAEYLVQQANMILEQEQRTTMIETRLDKVETITKDKGYMSIKGWCNINHVLIDRKSMALMGKYISRLCRQLNLQICKLKNEDYGEINTYPEELMDNFLNKYLNESEANND